MNSKPETITVEGKPYKVWSDYIRRCTFAENEAGERKAISSSGYLSNELSIRKVIALIFGHSTFKK